MCTLSVIPLPERRVRIAFNRDEQRTRPAAMPPRQQMFGRRAAVLPIDPVSRGTWLAVNDAGLILAILNVTPPGEPASPGKRSRGEIIPALLECDDPGCAVERLEQTFPITQFAPFRLVVIGNGIVATYHWDGQKSMVLSRLLGGTPMLFTSSGLGDHLVEELRHSLFQATFIGKPKTWSTAQDEFHNHRWLGLEHLSVNMERTDAMTVSRMVIEQEPDRATVHYYPVPFDTSSVLTTVLPFALEELE